ncbi:MAG TPA: sugar-binding protein, partial [Bacteroidota bacterium]|nr:sugar-binding protein [Bacteroidota bacterium]
LAVDQSNLYVAFDVVDDTVSVDTAATDYNQDSPDLFIGLYDWRGKKHASYSNGKTPDYHFRFSQNRIFLDNGAQVVMYPGANYSWKKKTFTAGYTVEAMIPFARLTEIDHTDSLFVPKEGMRIPIDFAINDRDSKADGTRDCILCYSPLANDNSWEFMYRWSYTWIGSQWTTGVTESGVVPAAYALEQNYPNPFNPATKINYTLAKPGVTTLKIFDVLGREVMTLVNEMQTAGNHIATFNASRLASGMYIYKLESGSFSSVKKMMFLK